jgi:ATP phosphoribosyltransferase regulatory subunit
VRLGSVVDEKPRSLEHPLPAGMRDLLPEEAASRRALARSVLERFALYGYRLVTPPAFELAEVLERGLGQLAASDVLRFIEPDSGEVAVLRPDMTPPIARIVATRLHDRPPPYRIAYEGTVVRRRVGRARKQRQMPQAGVELCGLPDAEGDLEILELAADALRGAGLDRFTIDLADAGIVRGLLAGAKREVAEAATAALARKDEALLAEQVKSLPYGSALLALPRLHGGRDAAVEAVSVLAGTPAEGPARRLLSLFDAAAARGLGPHLSADAGEVRGFAYYTGLIFSIFAPGPGEAVGAGGRYDDLLGRFGSAMPAVGLGLDLDALAWALRDAGRAPAPGGGVVVVGPSDDARVTALRKRGSPAVAIGFAEPAMAYAKAWRYALVWDGAQLVDVRTGVATSAAGPIDDAADAVTRVLEKLGRGE